jgi:hypothetical protein
MSEKEKEKQKEKEPVETNETAAEEEAKESAFGDYPEGKDKKSKEPLPFCRTAPDPEHLRGAEEEEPCDDYRSGDVPTDEEE